MGEDWERLLVEHPQVLWGVIADVIKAIKADEGERRTGRRPAVSVGSLDELYTLLFPAQYSTDPFPQALKTVLAGRSQRTFAAETGINQGWLSRVLSGKRPVTQENIEVLAYALQIPPTYFVEYRAQRIASIITEALISRPDFSAELMRRAMVAA